MTLQRLQSWHGCFAPSACCFVSSACRQSGHVQFALFKMLYSELIGLSFSLHTSHGGRSHFSHNGTESRALICGTQIPFLCDPHLWHGGCWHARQAVYRFRHPSRSNAEVGRMSLQRSQCRPGCFVPSACRQSGHVHFALFTMLYFELIGLSVCLYTSHGGRRHFSQIKSPSLV